MTFTVLDDVASACACASRLRRQTSCSVHLHLEYYERVRELVAGSARPTRVVLMNLQLIPLASGESNAF